MSVKFKGAFFFFLGVLSLLPGRNFARTFGEYHDSYQWSPDSIKTLIDSGQYLSAWTALNLHYPDTGDDYQKITQACIKSDFCLKYFSHTLNHEQFYFVNADSGKSLLEIRQTPLSTSQIPVNFSPEKELIKIERPEYATPEYTSLHYHLGQFYYDVWVTYKKKWRKSEDELIALFYYHYNECLKDELFTAQAYYAVSLYHQRLRSYKKAKENLKACLKMDPKHAAAHYNLALSYNVEDSVKLAIHHAEKAYDNYKVNQYKGDAAVMCGVLNCDLGNYKKGIRWLLVADALTPGNLVAYEYLLHGYLATGKKEEAELITKNLYSYDWKSGRIFNSVLEAHRKFNKEAVLVDFLNEEISAHPHDKEYLGFNHLHLCQIYIVIEDKNLALEHVEKAKDSFHISYDKEHVIFRLLEKITAQARNL